MRSKLYSSFFFIKSEFRSDKITAGSQPDQNITIRIFQQIDKISGFFTVEGSKRGRHKPLQNPPVAPAVIEPSPPSA